MITQRHNPAYRHACILFYRLRRDFPSRRPDSRESILPYAKHFRAFLAEAKSTAYEDLGMKAFLNALVGVSS